MGKKTKLFIAWGILYIACTVWGFIPYPQGALYGILFLTSLGFFVPPAILLYDGVQHKDRKLFALIRNISLASLILTVIVLILNFMTMKASVEAGRVLYWLLIIVSTPMICSQVWVVSLFCWACLLMVSIKYLRRFPK